jgi:hypothetical protein
LIKRLIIAIIVSEIKKRNEVMRKLFIMLDELVAQGFSNLADETEFLAHYPEPLWGCYRPQPMCTPEGYPVLMREEAVLDNPNGADYAVLSFVYPNE